jgi:hypothetical protein
MRLLNLFSIYVILSGPGVDSAANGNEYKESSYGVKRGRRVSWQPHRHPWANCQENVESSTSHNHIGLHGLLQEEFHFTYSCMYDSFNDALGNSDDRISNGGLKKR